VADRGERNARIRAGLRRADAIPAPDLWPQIERRVPGGMAPPRALGHPTASRVLVAAFALVVAAAGIGLAIRATSGSVEPASGLPAGLAIAFIGDSGSGGPALMVSAGGPSGLRTVTLARGLDVAFAPSWSADGSVAVFVVSARGGGAIAAWRRGTATARRLTGCCDDASPAVSADGRTVAFVRRSPAGEAILAIDAAGGSGDARTICAAGACGEGIADLAWSPDGATLAFSHAASASPDSGTGGIDLIAADGSGLRHLTACGGGPHCSVDLAPAWSPDGSVIAYNHGGALGHGQRIRTIEVATRGVHTVAACPQPHCVERVRPVWSPDGSTIAFPAFNAFGNGSPGIILVDVATGRRSVVSTCAGGDCFDPSAVAFSEDGSTLSFVQAERTGDAVRGEGVFGVPIRGGGAPSRVAEGSGVCCVEWVPSLGAS
jgi:Tol biopolymer transport system component